MAAFEARAAGYEQGWLGRLHHEIADRTSDLALRTRPHPQRLLDVGCGTGYLLRLRASRCPDAVELAGVDPAHSMIAVARAFGGDARLHFCVGVAERLPFPDEHFDLVVSSTSFDHWSGQLAGLGECARVLHRGGRLVLVDQFSRWLAPTLIARRRGRARTKGGAGRLLAAAGFRSVVWHDLYAVIIKAATRGRRRRELLTGDVPQLHGTPVMSSWRVRMTSTRREARTDPIRQFLLHFSGCQSILTAWTWGPSTETSRRMTRQSGYVPRWRCIVWPRGSKPNTSRRPGKRGWSWQQIGDALGVTRQSVHTKYNKESS